MKILRFSILLGLFVATAVTPSASAQSREDSGDSVIDARPAFLTSAATQEPSLFESALNQKNQELEQRIQRLEAELNRPTYLPQDPCCAIEQQLRRQECGSGGLFGAVEVTFLKPAVSGAPSAFAGTPGRMLHSSYQTGVRYLLGYTNDTGFGVRGSFWSFNQNSPYVPPYAPAEFGISVQAADAELTLAQPLRYWNLGITGGVRYGKLQYSDPGLAVYNPGMVAFEGIGPTASFSGRRNLGNSGFSLFGKVRGSMLVGDIRTHALLVNTAAGTIEDEVMTILENQLGLAWNYNLTSQMQLEVRTAWESQYWMNSTLASDYYGVGSNLALMGPTLAVELKY